MKTKKAKTVPVEVPFNQAVRTVRKRLKLTLDEFASKAGVSASLIYSFESGRRIPTDETLKDIRRALLRVLDEAIQKEKDDRRREREERLETFGAILDSVRTSAPELSATLSEYCLVGKDKETELQEVGR